MSDSVEKARENVFCEIRRVWEHRNWARANAHERVEDLIAAVRAEQPKGETIQIRFDGPPGPEAGRFVEVEDIDGKGIRIGEWVQDGEYWLLVIPGRAVQPQGGHVLHCECSPPGRNPIIRDSRCAALDPAEHPPRRETTMSDSVERARKAAHDAFNYYSHIPKAVETDWQAVVDAIDNLSAVRAEPCHEEHECDIHGRLKVCVECLAASEAWFRGENSMKTRCAALKPHCKCRIESSFIHRDPSCTMSVEVHHVHGQLKVCVARRRNREGMAMSSEAVRKLREIAVLVRAGLGDDASDVDDIIRAAAAACKAVSDHYDFVVPCEYRDGYQKGADECSAAILSALDPKGADDGK